MKPGDKVIFIDTYFMTFSNSKVKVGNIYTIKYLYHNNEWLALEEYEYGVPTICFITLKQKIIKDILNDH